MPEMWAMLVCSAYVFTHGGINIIMKHLKRFPQYIKCFPPPNKLKAVFGGGSRMSDMATIGRKRIKKVKNKSSGYIIE